MWNEVLLALSAAVSSGAGLKTLDWWLTRKKEGLATELSYREQFNKDSASLRQQIDEMRKAMAAVEQEADEWRSKYWRLYSQYNEFRVAVIELLIKQGIDVSLINNIGRPDA